MTLAIQCVRSLRLARKLLRENAPVGALQALMNAQGYWYRLCQGASEHRDVTRLQTCIKRVEDEVYPVIQIRRARDDGRTGT